MRRDFNESPVRFFIEFLPGALGALTGIPQEELRDRRFTLGEADAALAAALEAAAGRAADADALAEETDRLLLARFSGRALPGAVRGAMQRLRESSGMLPVGELAAESGYSQRHLNRLFGETVGMNVKTFARLVRVNGAIRAGCGRAPVLSPRWRRRPAFTTSPILSTIFRISAGSPRAPTCRTCPLFTMKFSNFEVCF